jgi:hypothetical protein
MRSKPFYFLCLGVLAAASAATAAPRVPGPEMQVNQVSTRVEQRHPVAAYAANGAAVVVWEDAQAGLKGRFLGRNGHAVGGDLTLAVNDLLPSIPASGNVVYRRNPAVTFLPTGGFALFWTEETDFEQLDAFIQQDTLLRRDVVGRIFSPIGLPKGPAFRVNGPGERLTDAVQVAVRGNELVVAWQSQGNGRNVLARRYDLSGRAIGDEIQVSSGRAAADPALAVGRDGRVAIAFDAPDASGLGVYVQLFDASFRPLGDAVRVNTTVAGNQGRPAIAANADGQYLVAWHGQFRSPRQFRVYGQVVGEAGNLIGGELALSGGSNRYEIYPSVAAGPHGDFVTVWLAFGNTLPVGIFANQVDALGRAGSEVQINQRSVNYNSRSSLATDGAGHFLAPWEGFAGNDPAISAQLLSE